MKRRPPWKLLCGLAAAVFVTIGVFFAWVQAAAARRWRELEKLAPALIAEARARDPRRPPVRGEPVPGSAWTDYNQALAAIKPMSSADLGDFVTRSPKADRAKAEAAVAMYAGCLQHLAAGARRAEGTYPYAFEKGFSADLPGLLESQKLANLAASKARMLAEAGKANEAVSLLLDELWFGADIGRNTVLICEMISAAILSIGMDELKDMVRDMELKDVDWAEVGRALAVLDTILPDHGESMLNEAVSAAAGLTTQEKLGADMNGVVPNEVLFAWRYGFSTRLMVVDAMDTHVDAMRRLAAANRTWPEAERVSKEVDGEAGRSVNLLTRVMTQGLLRSHRVGFERRAQLSLLRMAVALRAGQAVPELDDPFGAKLRSDGTKVWSLGQDGVDGGGVGAWRPAPTGDIVLQLRKDELERK